MDEKRPQISVTSLANPADTLLPPARMHPRSQPEPGRKVPGGLELTTVSHSCDDGARSDWAYAGCSRQPAAIFVVLVPLDNLSFDSSDLFFEHIDMIEEGIDSLAGDRRQVVWRHCVRSLPQL
ncbi:hypothetical protein EFR01_59880 [Sinorhizobium fredii]|nr:hypothetical protein EFR01_59880 [Sinorhizobium fredii]GLS09539.1 hypothetical protein GCM10007864_31700 [Sinorhizobium fredii]